MGRPPGTPNVTPDEIDLIRALHRHGARITEIVADTGRSESIVMRAVRGMKRKKPTRDPIDNEARNYRILRLTEEGMSRAEVGKEVGLTPNQVGYIIKHHPLVIWLLRVRKEKPAAVAKRFRMELTTAVRIATDGDMKSVPRVRGGEW